MHYYCAYWHFKTRDKDVDGHDADPDPDGYKLDIWPSVQFIC